MLTHLSRKEAWRRASTRASREKRARMVLAARSLGVDSTDTPWVDDGACSKQKDIRTRKIRPSRVFGAGERWCDFRSAAWADRLDRVGGWVGGCIKKGQGSGRGGSGREKRAPGCAPPQSWPAGFARERGGERSNRTESWIAFLRLTTNQWAAAGVTRLVSLKKLLAPTEIRIMHARVIYIYDLVIHPNPIARFWPQTRRSPIILLCFAS